MMPVLRDPCGYTYYREWGSGILAGGYEPKSKPCFHEGIPKPYEYMLIQEDWDHFREKRSQCQIKFCHFISPIFYLLEVLMDQMLLRVPALADAEIRQQLNGAESFSPDLKPIMGEAPNVS